MKSATLTAVFASLASAHYLGHERLGRRPQDPKLAKQRPRDRRLLDRDPVLPALRRRLGRRQRPAGGSVTWNSSPGLFHPGAMSAYMAKVPAGADVKTWDGSGSVWFKVYQDMPSSANGGYKWTSEGQSSFSLPVPKCLAEGDYLYRIEHVHVSGGPGAKTPSNLVAFPGAYKASDPGLAVNIYNTGGKPYQPAGPSVFQC
ncbi:endoglucanase II [Apiospora hydei]|uniref:lytic cellulose monooxygenase (C4-dehydrogenating) n=1 Tax=Apiospora hydei TaxID=1337664 RepID=A0ABR1VGN2_9PEZI